MARAVAIILGLMVVASRAEAADLCESLFVPDGYTLICETRIESGQRSERVVVRPSGGTAASLAELTIRPLERATAPLGLDRTPAMAGGPGGGGRERAQHRAAEPQRHGLPRPPCRQGHRGWAGHDADGLEQLPAEACTPEEKPRRHDLRCRWGIEPVALEMSQRLVEAGEQRFAVSYGRGRAAPASPRGDRQLVQPGLISARAPPLLVAGLASQPPGRRSVRRASAAGRGRARGAERPKARIGRLSALGASWPTGESRDSPMPQPSTR